MNMMPAGQLTSFGLNCAHAAKTLLVIPLAACEKQKNLVFRQ